MNFIKNFFKKNKKVFTIIGENRKGDTVRTILNRTRKKAPVNVGAKDDGLGYYFKDLVSLRKTTTCFSRSQTGLSQYLGSYRR